MPLACIIRARTHDQKNDCFFDLEMINDDYRFARGGFPLSISPLYTCSGSPGGLLLASGLMYAADVGCFRVTLGHDSLTLRSLLLRAVQRLDNGLEQQHAKQMFWWVTCNESAGAVECGASNFAVFVNQRNTCA